MKSSLCSLLFVTLFAIRAQAGRTSDIGPGDVVIRGGKRDTQVVKVTSSQDRIRFSVCQESGRLATPELWDCKNEKEFDLKSLSDRLTAMSPSVSDRVHASIYHGLRESALGLRFAAISKVMSLAFLFVTGSPELWTSFAFDACMIAGRGAFGMVKGAVIGSDPKNPACYRDLSAAIQAADTNRSAVVMTAKDLNIRAIITFIEKL